MFNHDSGHTGFSQSQAPKNPNIIWTFSDPNITHAPRGSVFVMSTPVISKGFLYISGATGPGLNALNASTGQLIWSNSNAYIFSPFATPAVYNNCVYVSAYGLIASLNALTGAQIWKTNFTNAYGNPEQGGSPTVVDEIVYVQGYSALYALNALTGAKMWAYPNKGSFATSVVPAIADGFVYSATIGKDFKGGYIYALDASDGKEIWKYSVETKAQSSPTVEGGKVFIGSNNNIYALNALTGALLWEYTAGLSVTGSPAVAYDMVYVGSRDTNIYALNASTGEKIWNYSTDAGINSSPAIADGAVYVNSDDRYLYALNASTGQLIWKYLTVPSENLTANYKNRLSSPAIAYSNLYISTDEGKVIAFGDESANTATPFFSTQIVILTIAVTISIATVLIIYIKRSRHV